MIRILIADDHAIVRRGVREILERELITIDWGEAGDAQQAVAQVQQHNWDLLILDIGMKGRSGLDALRDILLIRPDIRALVLSMHSESQYGKRVLMAGACGYLTKDSSSEELVKAIRKILAGGRYVSPALAETLACDVSKKSKLPAHENLSNRELEVLRMLASGWTVSQIAEEIHLGVATVSTYRGRILEKMNLKTTAELIHYAISSQLVA